MRFSVGVTSRLTNSQSGHFAKVHSAASEKGLIYRAGVADLTCELGGRLLFIRGEEFLEFRFRANSSRTLSIKLGKIERNAVTTFSSRFDLFRETMTPAL